MKLVIITGMSGAGKTTATKALEDIGYYCIDNLPPKLLPKFIEISMQAKDTISHIAIVTDVRSKQMFSTLFECIDNLNQNGIDYKMIFLDASDDVIMRRYKETRRKHPLQRGNVSDIQTALSTERKLLENAKMQADYVIDTSLLSTSQVHQRVIDIFEDEQSDGFMVNCMSFGFKYGIPLDADIVLDTRCFINPYYVKELKEHTGLESCVSDYVLDNEKSQEFLKKTKEFLDFLIPLYRDDEGKTHLNVCIGCTGGKHRSVTFAEAIKDYLISKDIRAISIHRDIAKVKY